MQGAWLRGRGRNDDRIGVPGSFDKATCTLRFGTNLGLNNVSFADAFLPEFGCSVHLDNDANCAALGEATAGAAKARATC